jgi:hypothetical protein
MAAPGGFGALAPPAPNEDALARQQMTSAASMPFEQKGMSFPGSAFYYLADPPSEQLVALPADDPAMRGARGGLAVGAAIATGPAASPLAQVGTGIDKARALHCLAQAVWYEAANESEAGQRAVAQVVLNRVAHPAWPSSVCGVVYQGSQRSTGCQFTFTCDGSLGRRAGGPTWERAQRIAQAALSGDVYRPIGLATHYHTRWVNPYWAGSLDHVGTIGAHIFYRNRGSGGGKGAFTTTYAGYEPRVTGRMVRAPEVQADWFADAGPFIPAAAPALPRSEPPSPAMKPGSAMPTSSQTDPADPAATRAGQARPEYANAGRWKKDPARIDPAALAQD